MKNLSRETYEHNIARNDACRMFIDEQCPTWQFRPEYLTAEQAIWWPVVNRHCCWTFQPNPYGKRLWG